MKPFKHSDLSVRQLSAVIAIADFNSFIAAASALHTSQPALTRTIKRIEDVVGVRLFDRSTRHVELTVAGKEFLPIARRMMNDFNLALTGLREVAAEQRGQIIVSVLMSVANGILPAIIGEYGSKYQIHLREQMHQGVIADVTAGEADFGITYLQDLPHALNASRVGTEVFDLITPRDHPLAKRRNAVIEISDLAGVPLVSVPQGSLTRRVLDAAASVHGVTLNHAIIVSQVGTMINFVRAGVGVAVAPSTAVTGLLGSELVRLRLGAPRLSRDVGIITIRDRELTLPARNLVKQIRLSWPKPKLLRGSGSR